MLVTPKFPPHNDLIASPRTRTQDALGGGHLHPLRRCKSLRLIASECLLIMISRPTAQRPSEYLAKRGGGDDGVSQVPSLADAKCNGTGSEICFCPRHEHSAALSKLLGVNCSHKLGYARLPRRSARHAPGARGNTATISMAVSTVYKHQFLVIVEAMSVLSAQTHVRQRDGLLAWRMP
jgi:hypothetical protein